MITTLGHIYYELLQGWYNGTTNTNTYQIQKLLMPTAHMITTLGHIYYELLQGWYNGTTNTNTYQIQKF